MHGCAGFEDFISLMYQALSQPTLLQVILITPESTLIRGQKYFNIALPGRVTYSFHSSCKHMHLSFKSICNKDHKGVICNMTSSSNSSQSTRPVG